MECFGKFNDCKECRECEYLESCISSNVVDRMQKDSNRGWKWRRSPVELRESAEEAVINEDLFEQRTYSREDLAEVINILLTVRSEDWLFNVLKKRLKGASFADIGKDLGVSRQAVHCRVASVLAKILGYQQRKDKSLNLRNISHQHLRILHLREQGYSYREISNELKCSQKTVRKALNSLKISKKGKR